MHGERGLACMQDEEAGGRFALAEENAIFIAGDGGGVFLQNLDELRIGDEGGGIEARQGKSFRQGRARHRTSNLSPIIPSLRAIACDVRPFVEFTGAEGRPRMM